MSAVEISILKKPDINFKEIRRYAGYKADTDKNADIIRECIEEAENKLSYRICHKRFPVSIVGNTVDLGFAVTQSEKLKINLNGCEEIILFAATVGNEFERLLKKSSFESPLKALFMQAYGDERIESLCDAFNREITLRECEKGNRTKPRFSPGYGDLALSIQKDIIDTLDCEKNIGIYLDDNYFMTPSKSVTAIIGIEKAKGK